MHDWGMDENSELRVKEVVSSQGKIARHFHFPFSNCHFSFVIARAAGDPQ
jgi:hypothetical protein